MFTLGQASSYNGSHATFPSQAVVGTVVQPLVISSGSYNPTNPPSKFLTINIQGCFYPRRQGVYFFFLLICTTRSDSPSKHAQRNQKRVYSQALILCFLLTYENAVNFFFLGIVTLFIKRKLRTETVRFAEINKSLSKWIWMNLNLKVNQ